LALVAVAAVAVVLVSGGSSADPRTPPAPPGMPPPFLTVAVVGDGGLTAGIDAYGDVVDLRAGPAGAALIDNPSARQAAGTVPADTGIVPLTSIGNGRPQPLWQADSVRQSYLPGTNVLRTVARFGGARVRIECAAGGEELGCVSGTAGDGRGTGRDESGPMGVSFRRNLVGDGRRIHLDDRRARRILAAAVAADRGWLARARALGSGAPAWARAMYGRSLLAMRALAGHNGAVAAGAREGWAYVWPRDAGAVAIALSAAGYRGEARRIVRFLLGLDLGTAARFDGDGDPVVGRAAQGDAAGWVEAAARAAGVTAQVPPLDWRNRADYQEKSPGDYLANALASAATGWTRFITRRGRMREAGDPGSGLDSAAAWAVRPFPQPDLFPAARRTLLRLAAEGGRFGLTPSHDWQGEDPWSAPTAWSAWSLAALEERRAATPAGLLPERVGARSGVPRSTTPLAWSHAFAVLALRRLWPGRRRRESR
jgi:hypothetical protein